VMTPATVINDKHTDHLLPAELLERRVRILLVGCGGTGSAMATGLVYLHQALLAYGHPQGLHVTLVDGDRISWTNCVRQPFSESEVGLYKADVLATRINLFWGLDWTAENRFLNEQWDRDARPFQIIISCVDSRAARKSVTETRAFGKAHYWLDLGNNADTGQFVLGEPPRADQSAVRLPTVADLFPEIIDPGLDAKDKLPSCSALEALESQSPFINQTLAYQALALLAQFFRRGRLTYHGGFLNLRTGRLSPLAVNLAARKGVAAEVKPTTSRRRAKHNSSAAIPA
jgi:PRTRC genetic system ThiF family protein